MCLGFIWCQMNPRKPLLHGFSHAHEEAILESENRIAIALIAEATLWWHRALHSLTNTNEIPSLGFSNANEFKKASVA